MAWGKKPENKPPEPQVVAAATTPTENKNLPPEATIDILTSTNALAALLVVLVSYLFVNRNKSGLGLNLSAALLRSDYAKGATAAKKAGGWPEYKLVEKHDLSKDSKRLRFEFPEKGVSKLDVGRHVMCRADINAERVVRPYSPVEFVAGKYLDLVVKAYENAKMSSYLHQLKVGQSIEMFGPVGSLKYSAGSFKHLVFICAGTGVTPVLPSPICDFIFDLSHSGTGGPLSRAGVRDGQGRARQPRRRGDQADGAVPEPDGARHPPPGGARGPRGGAPGPLQARARLQPGPRRLQQPRARQAGCPPTQPPTHPPTHLRFLPSSSLFALLHFPWHPQAYANGAPVARSQISGYIDEAVVSSNLEVAGEASSTKVFVCGPGGFNKGIQQICEGRGYGLEGTKELLHFF